MPRNKSIRTWTRPPSPYDANTPVFMPQRALVRHRQRHINQRPSSSSPAPVHAERLLKCRSLWSVAGSKRSQKGPCPCLSQDNQVPNCQPICVDRRKSKKECLGRRTSSCPAPAPSPLTSRAAPPPQSASPGIFIGRHTAVSVNTFVTRHPVPSGPMISGRAAGAPPRRGLTSLRAPDAYIVRALMVMADSLRPL